MFQWFRIRFKHFGIQTKYQIKHNIGNDTWTNLQRMKRTSIAVIWMINKKKMWMNKLWYISCVENRLSCIDFAIYVLLQLVAGIFNDGIDYFDLQEWKMHRQWIQVQIGFACGLKSHSTVDSEQLVKCPGKTRHFRIQLSLFGRRYVIKSILTSSHFEQWHVHKKWNYQSPAVLCTSVPIHFESLSIVHLLQRMDFVWTVDPIAHLSNHLRSD